MRIIKYADTLLYLKYYPPLFMFIAVLVGIVRCTAGTPLTQEFDLPGLSTLYFAIMLLWALLALASSGISFCLFV